MTENIYSFTRTVLRRAMLVLAVVALTQGGFAQTSSRQISGVVKDSLGPVLAATVVVDGTSIGVSTGIDGDFTINVPANAKRLVVSYVGYEDAYVDLVPSKTSYEIVLSESSTLMDDVVVVGYGVQKRSDLTGSVSSVNSKVLEAMPVSSAAEAITGRMAGVQVTTSEGGPDAEIKIRVRGGGSITQDNSPLFIVDGFPVSSINDIAPGDIQSIDVLKDASATAIYGARGANGVVIVTTKSGKEGKTSVSLNAYFGWKYLANELDVLDSYEYVTSQYELANRTATSWDNDSAFLKYYGAYGDLELYKNLSTTNWQQEIFGRTAFTQNYNASITVGTDKIKYNVGVTH
ncbi:MAG: TonB-dependent receptor plug domain-containing protein, partial [Alistipes sp.]|nr:TonB-dependent receptor plug domain-containing protein [Alistipes sp.]